ncbi:hypothetical protein BJP36_39150 [Moorena producens JHB]|uniref:Uncharacterized protein n=1 Tax=Moorena producens (strain JHB) TaxID=1454205 RepID=A0A9Q9SUX4_MOOP1|nr:hypothetical protein [Moorena producens]WAN70082.1 hypothetical protein BJP36_39150 [Moorena producens JHB]
MKSPRPHYIAAPKLPFPSCLLPIAYCLLPIAYCLLPIAFPSWEGLGVGSSC